MTCCRTSRDAELFRLTSDDGSKNLRRSFSLATGAAADDLVIFTLPAGQQDAAAALLAVCKRTTADELQISFQDGEQLQVGTLDAAAECWPAFLKRCCTKVPFDKYSTCRSACLLRSQPLWTCSVSSCINNWVQKACLLRNLLCTRVHLCEAAVLTGLAHLACWPAVQDLLLPLVVDLRRTNMLSHAVHRYIESVTTEAKQSIRSATLLVVGLSCGSVRAVWELCNAGSCLGQLHWPLELVADCLVQCLQLHPGRAICPAWSATRLSSCRTLVERALPILLGQQWTSLESMSLAEKLQVTPPTAVGDDSDLSLAAAQLHSVVQCLS